MRIQEQRFVWKSDENEEIFALKDVGSRSFVSNNLLEGSTSSLALVCVRLDCHVVEVNVTILPYFFGSERSLSQFLSWRFLPLVSHQSSK